MVADDDEERFEVVDEENNVTGTLAPRSKVHGEGILHRCRKFRLATYVVACLPVLDQ
jgi:hypothetical protein